MNKHEKLEAINNIYIAWNGKPQHAAICMRYINLILSDKNGSSTKPVEEFIEDMAQRLD